MLHRIAATHDKELAAEIASQMLHHLRAEPQFVQRPSQDTHRPICVR